MSPDPSPNTKNSHWRSEIKEGSILLVRFERPPANRLNAESLRELSKLLDKTEADTSLKCVVIASGVDGYFISDTEDSEWEKIRSSESPQTELVPWHRACSRLVSHPLPTIAAIDGVVSGAGIDIVLCADIRVAGPQTQLDFSEYASRRTIPYSGATQRLPRLVGKARALELIIGGSSVSANDAVAYGLVQRVADYSALEEALGLARAVSTLDRQMVTAAKTAVFSSEVPIAEGLALESRLAVSLIAARARTSPEATGIDNADTNSKNL